MVQCSNCRVVLTRTKWTMKNKNVQCDVYGDRLSNMSIYCSICLQLYQIFHIRYTRMFEKCAHGDEFVYFSVNCCFQVHVIPIGSIFYPNQSDTEHAFELTHLLCTMQYRGSCMFRKLDNDDIGYLDVAQCFPGIFDLIRCYFICRFSTAFDRRL
jgi:hypothetical protein